MSSDPSQAGDGGGAGGRKGPDGAGGVSRRGLFDVFGRGLKRLRDDLEEQRTGEPAAAEPPAPEVDYDQILRPEAEWHRAHPAAMGSWNLAFEPGDLDVGTSVIVVGAELPEPVVLVRVNEHHFAASTGECEIDGSHLTWLAYEDRIACPSCGSRWRLDGAVMTGPARSPLGRILADAYADDAGGVEARIALP